MPVVCLRLNLVLWFKHVWFFNTLFFNHSNRAFPNPGGLFFCGGIFLSISFTVQAPRCMLKS